MSIAVVGSSVFMNDIAYGLMKLSETDKPKVLFIQGQSCSGCTTSIMYGNESYFIDFILKVIRLQIHPTLSFIEGDTYLKKLDKMINDKDYVLVLEGAIPANQKKACMVGDYALYDLLLKAVKNAGLVISMGTCASYGGIPASGRNELGSIGLEEFLVKEKFIKNSKNDIKFIKTPGCPSHPDRFMGTLAYFVSTGKLPKLTAEKTPAIYYGEAIHNHCSRFQFFSQDSYLIDYDKENKNGCLLKKGCRGPITKSDCPSRRWNGGLNVCIKSNAPCVGCVNPSWPFKQDIYIDAKKFEDITWTEMREKINKNNR
jgi:hydrogenase small subunit